MKKWGVLVMLSALLVIPALACGFPLPAGTTMMAVSKAICAEGESVDSCQMRQDAYELMSKLSSATIQNLDMYMYMDDGSGSVTEGTFTGSYAYQVSSTDEGLGADLDATIVTGQITDAGGTNTMDGARFVIVGTKAYTSQDGGETWIEEELDTDALMGIGLLLGLGGTKAAGIDLFADPSIFTVTAGQDIEIDGQPVHVQTLSVDLAKLLGNAKVLGGLMESGFDAAGEAMGLSQESLGVTPEQVALMSGMLIPMLTGTEMSLTLYIGTDDGYIHRLVEKYIIKADLSAMSPDSKPITMTYELSGDITQHNMPLVITAPTNATAGTGLFGSGGLGGSLFGGQ